MKVYTVLISLLHVLRSSHLLSVDVILVDRVGRGRIWLCKHIKPITFPRCEIRNHFNEMETSPVLLVISLLTENLT